MHNIDQKLLSFGLGLKNTNGIQWLEDFQNQLQEVAHNSRPDRVPEKNPGLKHESHLELVAKELNHLAAILHV